MVESVTGRDRPPAQRHRKAPPGVGRVPPRDSGSVRGRCLLSVATCLGLERVTPTSEPPLLLAGAWPLPCFIRVNSQLEQGRETRCRRSLPFELTRLQPLALTLQCRQGDGDVRRNDHDLVPALTAIDAPRPCVTSASPTPRWSHGLRGSAGPEVLRWV